MAKRAASLTELSAAVRRRRIVRIDAGAGTAWTMLTAGDVGHDGTGEDPTLPPPVRFGPSVKVRDVKSPWSVEGFRTTASRGRVSCQLSVVSTVETGVRVYTHADTAGIGDGCRALTRAYIVSRRARERASRAAAGVPNGSATAGEPVAVPRGKGKGKQGKPLGKYIELTTISGGGQSAGRDSADDPHQEVGESTPLTPRGNDNSNNNNNNGAGDLGQHIDQAVTDATAGGDLVPSEPFPAAVSGETVASTGATRLVLPARTFRFSADTTVPVESTTDPSPINNESPIAPRVQTFTCECPFESTGLRNSSSSNNNNNNNNSNNGEDIKDGDAVIERESADGEVEKSEGEVTETLETVDPNGGGERETIGGGAVSSVPFVIALERLGDVSGEWAATDAVAYLLIGEWSITSSPSPSSGGGGVGSDGDGQLSVTSPQPPRRVVVLGDGTCLELTPVYGLEDKDALECVVCLTDDKVVTLLPCRHACLCKGCHAMLDKCPICREEITAHLISPSRDDAAQTNNNHE